MFHANVDIISIVVIVVIVIIGATAIGYVAPQISSARAAIADIQNADVLANARIEGQKAQLLAQADALRVQSEISKTQALAQADVARKQAEATHLQAQRDLEKTKADGQVQMARVSADATIAQQTVSGLVTLVVALLSSLGLGFIARTIHQAYRDKLKAQNARQAIEHLALNGGSMTLDTGHSFTIRPKYEVMPIGIEPPQVQTNFTVAEKEKVEIPQVSRTPRISR